MGITLIGEQATHCQKLKGIFQRSSVALDLSALGCGKTYTGSFLATDPDLGFKHLMVVAPVSVLGKWIALKAQHGLPLTHALSYCQLRGTQNTQPSHKLLTRGALKTVLNDHGFKTTAQVVSYDATAAYRKLVDEGLLLIIDEMQNIKNLNTQTYACRELCNVIHESFERGGRSRMLFMSGTPIDHKDQVIHMLRCMQILKQPSLCVLRQHGMYEWRGMRDIVSCCLELEKRDPVLSGTTARIMGNMTGLQYYMRAEELRNKCYKLFQKVIKHGLASEMPPVKHKNVKLHKANAFFAIDAQSEADLAASVRMLEEAARYDPTTRTVTPIEKGTLSPGEQAEHLSQITEAMMRIEKAKLGTMALTAAQTLNSFENVKIVLCLNYSTSIEEVKHALIKFKPLILQGTMSARARQNVVSKFQERNTDHRLLIANLRTCSTGIDLDDKDGEFPRYCIASPTYSVIDVHQLGHRFLRMDTKSDTILHMMYGSNASELHVLTALASKTAILKDTAQAQVGGGVLFPGDYPRYDAAEKEALIKEKNFMEIANWGDPSLRLVSSFSPYLRARKLIGEAMTRAYLDSKYAWCRRRLQREFEEMSRE